MFNPAMRWFVVLAVCCGSAWAQIEVTGSEIELSRVKGPPAARTDDSQGFDIALGESRDNRILKLFARGIDGVRIKLAPVVTGSGFSTGLEYKADEAAGGALDLSATARVSVRGYQMYELHLRMPRLGGGQWFSDISAVRRSFPQINFFGQGSRTFRTGRSNYTFESTAIDAAGGRRLGARFYVGAAAGFLRAATGPGEAPGVSSAQDLYRISGFGDTADFLRGGFFAQYDSRDNPSGPRRGSTVLAQWMSYSGVTEWNAGFQRLILEAQHYIPLFNDRRVIALRGRSVFSGGGAVPFYLQPTLGGPDDLRGFHLYRFRDRNAVIANAEWRWEVFSGLDMALFGDAGNVFPEISRWSFDEVKASWGFGLRFNIRNSVFLRTDVAFSYEGYRIWFKFYNPF